LIAFRQQVLQASNLTSAIFELHNCWIFIFSIFFNASSSGHVEDLSAELALFHDSFLSVVNGVLPLVFLKSSLQIFAIKDITQFGVVLDFLTLVHQGDFWLIMLQSNQHFVNFSSQSITFFLFDLPCFEHGINIVLLLNQQMILGSSRLNCFGDFWELLNDMDVHVVLCLGSHFVAFIQNFVHEVLVFNHVGDHMASFLVCVNEINDDVICCAVMPEKLFLKHLAIIWVLGETLKEIEVAVVDNVTINELPIIKLFTCVIKTSVC